MAEYLAPGLLGIGLGVGVSRFIVGVGLLALTCFALAQAEFIARIITPYSLPTLCSISVSQATGKGIWVNLPVSASCSLMPDGSANTSTYCYQWAMLLKNGNSFTNNTGVPANSPIYVEHSNEVRCVRGRGSRAQSLTMRPLGRKSSSVWRAPACVKPSHHTFARLLSYVCARRCGVSIYGRARPPACLDGRLPPPHKLARPHSRHLPLYANLRPTPHLLPSFRAKITASGSTFTTSSRRCE